MHWKRPNVLRVSMVALLLTLSGCAAAKSDHSTQSVASPAPSPAATPIAKQITTRDLKQLRWIEGTWRGTGGGVSPFFERYTFENDSTLKVEGFDDEALTKVSDTGRFELKDGRFGKDEGNSGSVATALDDSSITFAPLGKAKNSFRFQRESDNSWKAILNWKDKNGVAQERVYVMERWPAKK